MGRRSARKFGGEKDLNPFRRLNDAQLAQLAPLELIAYIKDARAAGETAAALDAAKILAFTHSDRIETFVRRHMRGVGEVVIEEVAAKALAGAIDSAHNIRGETEAEVRAFFFRIARNKMADHHRSARGDFRHVPAEWTDEHGNVTPIEPGEPSDPFDALDRMSVFSQAFRELNEVHQVVIALIHFRDLPHAEVAEETNRHFGEDLPDPMTEQNVNQIKSRFSKRLDELEAEAERGSPDG